MISKSREMIDGMNAGHVGMTAQSIGNVGASFHNSLVSLFGTEM